MEAQTRFLRKAQVALRYGINVRSLERWVKDGRLPAPIYHNRFPLWRESDLDAADRAAMTAPRPKRSAGSAESKHDVAA
jgi:predicted DNA-binding transcriptional regulator AlpA